MGNGVGSGSARALAALVLVGGVGTGLYAGCSGEEGVTTSGAGTTGGAGTTATGVGGGSTTSTASTTGNTGGAGGSATTTSSTGESSSSAGGDGGNGGGGMGPGWPDCNAPPPGVANSTIPAIWQQDPSQPTLVWVPGVFVTAVSAGGCQAGTACQLFVQQDEQYADLAAGAKHAIKLFASANTAKYFVGLKPGDKVDVQGHAWRYDLMGQHELLIQVNLQLPGCAKVVGSGDPKPVSATLSDLTLGAYEDTVGPLLVKVEEVSGKPQMPDETFALWTTGVFSDAGLDAVVSLSPFFLPGAAFAGLQSGKIHDFTSVTGVFGVYLPPNSMTKYKEIYPRSMQEVVIAGVK